MDSIKVNKVSDLKKKIGDYVTDDNDRDDKVEFILDESLESEKFKVTIEVIQQDHYIDKKGQKWIREKKK